MSADRIEIFYAVTEAIAGAPREEVWDGLVNSAGMFLHAQARAAGATQPEQANMLVDAFATALKEAIASNWPVTVRVMQ